MSNESDHVNQVFIMTNFFLYLNIILFLSESYTKCKCCKEYKVGFLKMRVRVLLSVQSLVFYFCIADILYPWSSYQRLNVYIVNEKLDSFFSEVGDRKPPNICYKWTISWIWLTKHKRAIDFIFQFMSDYTYYLIIW